jgi:hypothetical protein
MQQGRSSNAQVTHAPDSTGGISEPAM